MTKKWIALTLLLLGFAAWLGWLLRQSILDFNAKNDPAKIQPARDVKQKFIQDKTAPQPVAARVYNPSEFTVISEKNLFADTRSKETVVEIAAPPEPPPLAQKPILVGINIPENQQPTALIIDPTAQQPQVRDAGRRAQIKRIGDVYQGYTIKEIAEDRIILESGTRKEIILLRDGAKRTQQGKTPILSTRVVAFGAGASSGGTPVTTLSGAPIPGGAQRGAAVSIGSAPPSPQPSTTPGSVQAAAPARTGQTSTQQSQPPPTNPAAAPTRIIRTPFGDIVRPVRPQQ